ncbi:MAG TPA: hypothetical protein VMW27_20785 [Thermoanaerobaculia bacterium]|nr:hypothetical protein [Thermoanaerobaculia bacterium]
MSPTNPTSPAMSQKVGDDALQAKTGKNWEEWFAVLDQAGAASMSHSEIAQHLYGELGVDGWWSQMVTVGYEQARGRREKHQKPDGYEVSVSKTVGVPVDALFAAWQDDAVRNRWLQEPGLTVRRATPGKSMRITWPDQTSVTVNFYAKGEGKSQVAAQHGKLPDAEAAARMKAWWAKALARLQSALQA